MKQNNIDIHIVEKARKKALQSHCRYKISCICLNRKNEVIDYTTNHHRFEGKGKGLHAEMLMMLRNPKATKSLIICRVNKKGEFLPIDPCPICSKKAKELGIKIYTIN